MKIRIALAAAVLALLTGCGTTLTHGYVVDKQYTEAYQWMELMCFAYDSNGVCTTQLPVWHHEPASWELCVERDAVQDWWSVSQETYDHIQVGDYVERSKL